MEGHGTGRDRGQGGRLWALQNCCNSKSLCSADRVCPGVSTAKEGLLEEEIRQIDECDTEKFSALDSSEKTIAVLGDRWWPQKAKQQGHRVTKNVL